MKTCTGPPLKRVLRSQLPCLCYICCWLKRRLLEDQPLRDCFSLAIARRKTRNALSEKTAMAISSVHPIDRWLEVTSLYIAKSHSLTLLIALSGEAFEELRITPSGCFLLRRYPFSKTPSSTSFQLFRASWKKGQCFNTVACVVA